MPRLSHEVRAIEKEAESAGEISPELDRRAFKLKQKLSDSEFWQSMVTRGGLIGMLTTGGSATGSYFGFESAGNHEASLMALKIFVPITAILGGAGINGLRLWVKRGKERRKMQGINERYEFDRRFRFRA